MDNLTHTLTAVAMSQAGLRRFTPHATITLIVASNLSDLDIVTVLQGSTAYLEHHRGITHSLVGVTALAGILAALMIAGSGLLARMRGRPPGKLSFLPLFGVCLAGTASHLLLDFTNSYGVRPFLPFSGKWYAWDILFIIDPLVILALVAALILPALLRMVAEEVGARKPRYSWGPAVGLAFMALLWGVRDTSHRQALDMLGAYNYAREAPLSIGAFPSTANPFLWNGVVETPSAFHVLSVNTLTSSIDPERTRVFYKAARHPALDAAQSTYAAKVFSDFARFPWITRRDRPRGYRVELRDLRFLSATRRRQAFVVGVELDLEFSVLEEVFSFSGPPERRQPRSRPGNSNPLLRGEEGRTISSNHPVTQHHDPHDHQRHPSKVIPKIRLSLFPVTRTQIGNGPES